MLFRLENVAKEFGAQTLFSGVTAQANPEDRIGLIGRNGSGKTTLLEIIQGRLEPDSGRVVRASQLEVSRIEQIPDFDRKRSVRQLAVEVFDRFRAWEERLRQLEAEMAESGVSKAVAGEYEQLRSRLALEGGYDYQARTESVLLGLGFQMADLEVPCGRLSGGQISRLALARTLLQPAGLMLLDEPTNHLDLEGLLWLGRYLTEQSRPYLLISHDRHFLDEVTTRTWKLENQQLTAYRGAFSAARRLEQERLEQRQKEYQRQQTWKAKTEEFVRRNLYGQKTKQAQSRRRQLRKADWVERPFGPSQTLQLRIREAGRGGAVSLALRRAAVGYPGKVLIEDLNLTLHRGERLAILGGNGSGKSTLLLSMMQRQPLLGGVLEWGANIVPAYFSQSPRFEPEESTIYEVLRRQDLGCTDEQLRSYAARFLFREDEIFKSVESLSGGEKSRLALARLFYHPSNVLLMDEPTNHLDIDGREALEEALLGFEGTLVIVSHDLYFVERVVDTFYLIREHRLEQLPELAALRGLLLERPGKETSEETASAPRASEGSSEPRRAVALSKNERLRRQRSLEELESRIESLESRQARVLEALQNGCDYQRMQQLSEEAHQLEQRLGDLYRRWEETAAQLRAGNRVEGGESDSG